MKFLRDKSLKQLGGYALVLIVVIFLAQYLMVRQKINRLNEVQRKIDFTRTAQLAAQKIFLQVQLALNGEKKTGPEIASAIDYQDYLLKTLSEGGRIEGTPYFIKPLKRLPGITFQGLKESWNEYKTSAFTLITDSSGTIPQNSLSADTLQRDSAKSHVPADYVRARIRQEGLSLRLSSWFDTLVRDLQEEIQNSNDSIAYWIIFFILFNIIILVGLYLLFYRNLILPLHAIEKNVTLHKHSLGFPQNELGKLAGRVNEIIENLSDASDFVTAIGKGNLELNYKETLDTNYTPGTNALADSLIEMQAKLHELHEEERKRQWANEGLAKFVDILRSSSDNLNNLCDEIISALVQYTKSNQGALYILNDENEKSIFLELISLFAFDIKKFEQQKIKPGQGILGQAFLEKETTYLTNLPKDYIRITSGLGGTNPKSILIVPLKVDKQLYGLVELASFSEYRSYEIGFVEKLGETIASTVGNVRSAQKNRQLIEQFQQQTEEMRAQEEEMRQNMEELQATQEEIARKEKGYLARIQELESTPSLLPQDLESLKEELRSKEHEYHLHLEQLQKELNEKKLNGNEWTTAEELNEALRINLEALRITQDELDRKQ